MADIILTLLNISVVLGAAYLTRRYIVATIQEQHDAVLAAVVSLKTATDTARDAVVTKLDTLESAILALQNANPAVDFSDVLNALSDAQTEVTGIGSSADSAVVPV